MIYQKLISSRNQPSKFRTRYWVEINNESRGADNNNNDNNNNNNNNNNNDEKQQHRNSRCSCK